MSIPILATKLYIPRLRPHVVSRPRLLERLKEGLHGKLTLISAPAGFGKTTLDETLRDITRIHDLLTGIVGKGILEAHEQRYVRNKTVGCLHCEEGWWPIDLSGGNTFGHR